MAQTFIPVSTPVSTPAPDINNKQTITLNVFPSTLPRSFISTMEIVLVRDNNNMPVTGTQILTEVSGQNTRVTQSFTKTNQNGEVQFEVRFSCSER